jgi:DNA repair exonuclease SbcCD ATPase subunit
MMTDAEKMRADLIDVLEGKVSYESVQAKWKAKTSPFYRQIIEVTADYREKIKGLRDEYKAVTEKCDNAKNKLADANAKLEQVKNNTGTLNDRKRGIEQSITELESKEKKAINSLQEAENELQSMRDKMKGELSNLTSNILRWGEIMAEAGKLEEELKIARYIRADPSFTHLPNEFIVYLLDKVRLWCELNDVNPKVKLPEGMKERYFGVESYAEVGLTDLLRWAFGGLREVGVKKK